MLKHHKKLKKYWRDSEVLSMIAGKQMMTPSFEKELIKIIQRDTIQGDRFSNLITNLRRFIKI